MKEYTKKVILLTVICIVTLALLVAALKINENRKNNLLASSSISDYLTEIKYEEISAHVIEQPNTVVYVSNSSNEASTNFERYFKNIIKKYNLENEIIYININNTTIIDPVYQYAPELIFYKDGEISDIIDCTTIKNEKNLYNELTQRGVISD